MGHKALVGGMGWGGCCLSLFTVLLICLDDRPVSISIRPFGKTLVLNLPLSCVWGPLIIIIILFIVLYCIFIYSKMPKHFLYENKAKYYTVLTGLSVWDTVFSFSIRWPVLYLQPPPRLCPWSEIHPLVLPPPELLHARYWIRGRLLSHHNCLFISLLDTVFSDSNL